MCLAEAAWKATKMLSVLLRRISRLGVTAVGLLLILWGLTSMWAGWDQIMIERGWSLFIGGSALVAGGAVTFSTGFVLARLDALTRAISVDAGGRDWPQQPATAHTQIKPREPQMKAVEAQKGHREALAFLSERTAPPLQSLTDKSEPVVIDRYDSGDATFTMYSDGSVEVRTNRGAQRYASVSELRAQMEL
jgi:hypothetical protein